MPSNFQKKSLAAVRMEEPTKGALMERERREKKRGRKGGLRCRPRFIRQPPRFLSYSLASLLCNRRKPTRVCAPTEKDLQTALLVSESQCGEKCVGRGGEHACGLWLLSVPQCIPPRWVTRTGEKVDKKQRREGHAGEKNRKAIKKKKGACAAMMHINSLGDPCQPHLTFMHHLPP